MMYRRYISFVELLQQYYGLETRILLRRWQHWAACSFVIPFLDPSIIVSVEAGASRILVPNAFTGAFLIGTKCPGMRYHGPCIARSLLYR
jgi:hypothetical protein